MTTIDGRFMAEDGIGLARRALAAGPNDTILIARDSAKTDYGVALAVAIGRTARYLDSPDDGLGTPRHEGAQA